MRHCTLILIQTGVESAWLQRLKLSYEKLLLRFALNFTLRRYTLAISCTFSPAAGPSARRVSGPGGWRYPRHRMPHPIMSLATS